jgi:hypothetical protein
LGPQIDNSSILSGLLGGPSFAKSIKLGACDVEVISADLTYQVNTMKLSVKFNVQQLGGGDHIHGSSGFGFGW